MDTKLFKDAGLSLIIGSVLITITMILHPAGGDIPHLLRMKTFIITTHCMAIASIPLMVFGFWGLTRRLGSDNGLALLGFIIIVMGLLAAMCAAAVNGLALPFFLNHYQEGNSLETITPILNYSLSLNHAMDYIFIGACCISILLWSILIFSTANFKKWMAYYGFILVFSAIVALFLQVEFTSLTGFRLFIFGLVGWMVCAGVILRIS